jgi:hypothetical protein
VLAFQDSSASVLRSSGWKARSSSSHYGGSARSSSTAGAWQRLTTTASDFALVSTLGPNRGKADVYIDSVKVGTVDLYSATTKYRQVVFAWDFGSPGAHTIELRVTHTKSASSSGYRVDFDAFLALAP